MVTGFQRDGLIKSKDQNQYLTVRSIIAFEYTKENPPKACSVDRGTWTWPQLSRHKPADYTFLPKSILQTGPEGTLILQYQGQKTKVKQTEFVVDKLIGRITIPKLKICIDI